jgi:FkbM family methyltransferase
MTAAKRLARRLPRNLRGTLLGMRRITVRTFSRLFPSHSFADTAHELIRLESLPRHVEFETLLDGVPIKAFDTLAYVSTYTELFRTEIYKFRAKSQSPFVVDCGANIGLSVIYFKRLYPKANIVAFEPDPYLFGLLEGNVRALDLDDVTLVPKGVWSTDGELHFVADPTFGLGGRVAESQGDPMVARVPVTRLRQYLDRNVDFLKLDIEGAECEVIKDCADLLGNVENIFVEYHSFAGSKQCLGELMHSLSSAGFRLHIQCVGRQFRNPFLSVSSYENGMDMQLNIFGMRPGERSQE